MLAKFFSNKLCLLLLAVSLLSVEFAESHQPSQNKEDNKPSLLKVDNRKEGFVHVDTFFNDFVATKSPLLFETGARIYPAVEKWKVDSYFVEIPHSSTVWINVTKHDGTKEEMKLKSFFQQYNDSKLVYEGFTPSFMRVDLLYAPVLHCDSIKSLMSNEKLVINPGIADKHMRTAANDELLCQVIGNSSLVLIDAPKHQSKLQSIADHADFDLIDYEKFPSLKGFEYYRTNLTAGSCIYIPSKWKYLLAPKNRSIAHVTSWNKRTTSKLLDRKKCGEWKQMPTLVAVNFINQVEKDDFTLDAALHFLSFSLEGGKNSYNKKAFLKQMSKDIKVLGQYAKWNEEYEEIYEEIFAILDINGDKVFSQADLDYVKKEDLPRLRALLGDRMIDVSDIVQDQATNDATAKAQAATAKQAIEEKISKATTSMTDGLQKQLDQMQKVAKELQGNGGKPTVSEADLEDLMGQLNKKLEEAKEKIAREELAEPANKQQRSQGSGTKESKLRHVTESEIDEGEEILAEEDDEPTNPKLNTKQDTGPKKVKRDPHVDKKKPKKNSEDIKKSGRTGSKQEL